MLRAFKNTHESCPILRGYLLILRAQNEPFCWTGTFLKLASRVVQQLKGQGGILRSEQKLKAQVKYFV